MKKIINYLIHACYSAITFILLPALILRLFYKNFSKKGYTDGLRQRLGLYDQKISSSIWIHAVSLGEVNAATQLIKILKQNFVNLDIIVTTQTPSGSIQLKKQFGNTVYHSYVPFDVPLLLNSFIKKINPKILIVMETELWPNIFRCCKKNKVPVIIVNGRISDTSFPVYQKIKFFLSSSIWPYIDFIACQSENNKKKFLRLGFQKEKTESFGNIKFDMQIPKEPDPKYDKIKNILTSEKVFLASSTHHNEEEYILNAFAQNKKNHKDLVLLIVPRHIERTKKIEQLINSYGFKYKLFTQLIREQSEGSNQNSFEILLCDTIGDLLFLYSKADVAFIGGSMVKIGGHNMLEAAAFSVPIITGPYTFNFYEITEMLSNKNAIVIINNQDELNGAVNRILDNKKYADKLGKAANEVYKLNHGTIDKYIKKIESLINLTNV